MLYEFYDLLFSIHIFKTRPDLTLVFMFHCRLQLNTFCIILLVQEDLPNMYVQNNLKHITYAHICTQIVNN